MSPLSRTLGLRLQRRLVMRCRREVPLEGAAQLPSAAGLLDALLGSTIDRLARYHHTLAGPISHFGNLRFEFVLSGFASTASCVNSRLLTAYRFILHRWFACSRGAADVQSAATLMILVGRPYMWEASAQIPALWPPPLPPSGPDDPPEPPPSPMAAGDSDGSPNSADSSCGGAAGGFSSGRGSGSGSGAIAVAGAGAAGATVARDVQYPALGWSYAYIELLQRHQLHSVAMRVAHLAQCEEMVSMNQVGPHSKDGRCRRRRRRRHRRHRRRCCCQ